MLNFSTNQKGKLFYLKIELKKTIKDIVLQNKIFIFATC